jgi:RimJ/RimL family protein N-acetyltransferase
LILTETFKTFPIIETERLRLREIVPADAEALFKVFSDPKVMAGHGTPVHQSVADTRRLIDWYAHAYPEKRALRWAVTRHGEDTLRWAPAATTRSPPITTAPKSATSWLRPHGGRASCRKRCGRWCFLA